MPKTSKEWVEQISQDSLKLHHWLERQYIGEELNIYGDRRFNDYLSMYDD